MSYVRKLQDSVQGLKDEDLVRVVRAGLKDLPKGGLLDYVASLVGKNALDALPAEALGPVAAKDAAAPATKDPEPVDPERAGFEMGRRLARRGAKGLPVEIADLPDEQLAHLVRWSAGLLTPGSLLHELVAPHLLTLLLLPLKDDAGEQSSRGRR